MTRPCELSAIEALTAFRARTLSPVELLEDVIERAAEVEPTVNALCVTRYEEALREARRAEERYAREGVEPGPLEGLPVGIKDEVPVAGEPCSMGSVLRRDVVATHTAPIAERILSAGAIAHARTTTPEFSCTAFTHSNLWGVTRSPWNPEFAVGGSSGGSGAALASATATLASGSDIGGSIRVPASFNGVVGFKPPYGRVPGDTPFNLDRYCHDGPMARTVADCRLMQNALAGPHPADPVALAPKLELPEEPAPVDGMRIALSVGLGDWPVDPEIEARTREVGDALRAAGASVEEIEVPIARAEVLRAMAIHWRTLFAPWIDTYAEEGGDRMTAYARAFPRWCEEVAEGGAVLDGMEIEVGVQRRLGAVFERFDALVCPTVATTGLRAGEDYVDRGPEVAGTELSHHLEAMLTAPFNLASRCPVLAVPSGVAANGVPTGVQIVAAPYQDAVAFQVGAAVEAARPWRRTAPTPTAMEEIG